MIHLKATDKEIASLAERLEISAETAKEGLISWCEAYAIQMDLAGFYPSEFALAEYARRVAFGVDRRARQAALEKASKGEPR